MSQTKSNFVRLSITTHGLHQTTDTLTIFLHVTKRIHSERRWIVANVYSMSSVLESEEVRHMYVASSRDPERLREAEVCGRFRFLGERVSEALDMIMCNKKILCCHRKRILPGSLTCPLRYAFDVLGELFYSEVFGFMRQRTDIGNYMKAIGSLLPVFTIRVIIPSYLRKPYLISTKLFSPSIRAALGAVKHLENAPKAAVQGRKEELEATQDHKQDMFRKMLDISADRREEVRFTCYDIVVESHSSL